MILALIAVLALPRLLGINLFATIDEPFWLTAGSNFYYALGQRDFENTIYDYHPAVTTMWIVAGAMWVYFPQYRGLGQGYFDVYKDSLDRFLLLHNHSPLGLLTVARLLQASLIVALLLVMFGLLQRLLGRPQALGAILLISFDPFFLGHSRLMNHEGMLALFVLISVLALVLHLFFERSWRFVILSAVAAGLAQLTKSSSLLLLPVASMLWFLRYLLPGDLGRIRRLGALLIEFAVWLLVLALVYVALWPGMWVAPGKMLHEVFGNAFSYAFEGARLTAAAGATPANFQPRFLDIVYYVQSILWRTTPIVWIGLALAIFGFAGAKQGERIVLVCVLLMGALFVLLFGIASGRNSAHYVLTSYVALDILAGAGWTYAAAWLGRRVAVHLRSALPLMILGAATFIQAASALSFFPYYYTYFSPIMEALKPGRQNPNFGYGEALDRAAAYLNQLPGASQLTAMAFYGRGPFSYFFAGKTEPLKSVYADAGNMPELEQALRHTDYLVIYYALERGRNTPANVMRALEAATPQKVIWLNGIEYVRIYRVDSLPPNFSKMLQP